MNYFVVKVTYESYMNVLIDKKAQESRVSFWHQENNYIEALALFYSIRYLRKASLIILAPIKS